MATEEADLIESPKNAYNYEAYHCESFRDVEEILNRHKDRVGFYWYAIPRPPRGVIIVIATANLEAIEARKKPRIELGLQPLTEPQAKATIDECFKELGKGMHNVLDTFLTVLYERGYEVCKRVNREVKP